MRKLGRKRKSHGMSGARRRNVKCGITDSKFEKTETQAEDEDYIAFLEWSGLCQQNDVNDNDNDNDDDPQYKMFLENTEQEGTSYVTRIEENGLLSFVLYEKEGRSGDVQYRDEDYDIALKIMQSEGHDLKSLFPKNQYVEDDCNDSGDEVVEISYATFCSGGISDANVSKVQYCEVGNTCELLYKNEHSQFRQKMISILKRPYDHTEYEQLLQDVNVRKPVEKNIQLRGRERSCPSNILGKSYLDWFKDFSKKLEEVSPDKHKMLNILRGFFFWLENIEMVGAFKPWNDPTCLAVMPGS